MSRTSGKRRQVRPNRRLWNLGQRSKGRTSRIRWFSWLRKFPFKLFLGIVGLFLLFEIFTLPLFSIANLDTDNPKVTALMQQRKEEAKDKGKALRIDYRWVPLSKIPKHVRMAVLVAEDGAFFSHAMGLIGMRSGNLSKPTWKRAALLGAGRPSRSNSLRISISPHPETPFEN